MASKMKECKKCPDNGRPKSRPATEFPRDKKRHDGLSDWCKECWRDYRNGGSKSKKSSKKAAPAKKVAVKSKSATKAKKPAKEVS